MCGNDAYLVVINNGTVINSTQAVHATLTDVTFNLRETWNGGVGLDTDYMADMLKRGKGGEAGGMQTGAE